MNNSTQPNLFATPQNRDFTGIWIPREVWLAKGLSAMEKILWAEIRSLSNPEKGGCFASNDYLCQFLGVKERRLQELLASLKSYGLIAQVSFDGRERIIRAIVPPDGFIVRRAEVQKSAPLGCGKVHPSGAEKCAATYIYNKVDNKEDNITPTPRGEEPPIGGVGVNSFSSSKQSSKKAKEPDIPKDLYLDHILLTKDEHAKLLDLHGEKELLYVMEILNAFIGSTGKVYKSHYFVLGKGGWAYKRLQEDKAKNPNLKPSDSTYKRYGKMAIEADKRAEPTERQHLKVDPLTPEQRLAAIAKLRAEASKK